MEPLHLQSQGNDSEREMIVVVEEYLISHRERNHQLLDLKAQVRSSLTIAIIEDRASEHGASTNRAGYPNRDRIV
jgi:hypothetical protein